MLKQQISQKLQQKLSPLQIQQVKMLELSTLELENKINQELEENPALEESSEFSAGEETEYQEESNSQEEDLSLGDYLTEDDIPDGKILGNTNYSKENQHEIPYSELESFDEYMMSQLHLRNLSEKELKIGEYIIGNLDEDGYLRRPLSAISDDLAFQSGMDVQESEIKSVLDIIKDFDPVGVGASSLQECLLLQIRKKEKTPTRNLAQEILEDFFPEFSKKHYDRIEKALDLKDDDLKAIFREIISLNPKPGNAWESSLETKLSQITPDFVVEVINGKPVLSIPEQNIPELCVSREFQEMFNDYSKNKKNQTRERKEALLFVKQKLDSAKWFIDAVRQRQNTLQATMQSIIQLQEVFFITGEESDLRPMILRDVAELSGYDISTISRVSNSKYVQTDSGIYSLKFFFSEALTNESGEEVSTREVKAILRKCIDKEDKQKPLTDDSLAILLKNRGYEIARRTVAKYREQLGIPVARLRKEIQ